MAKYGDFKEYMEDKYYNELYDCVKGYVCQNRDRHRRPFELQKLLTGKYGNNII